MGGWKGEGKDGNYWEGSLGADHLHSGSGTIGHTPTAEKDTVNKEYVDSLIRSMVDLFLTEDSSDIGGYFDLVVDVDTSAEQTITQTITANSTTLIASFASKLDEEEVDAIRLLESGIYGLHIHALANFAKNMTFYYEFYHRTSGGTETLLGTSHDSSILTTTEAEYDVHASITTDKSFVSGDRIVIKIYGRNIGAADKDITIHMEGDTAARIDFPGFIPPAGASLWEVDGSETQLKTADEIDMQTKKILNVVDPTADQEAATKKYVDDNAGATVGLVPIASQSASNNATINFISGIDSTYDHYLLVGSNVVPANDGVIPRIRLAVSGGAFKSGSTDYSWSSPRWVSTMSVDRDLSDSEIQFSTLLAGSAAGESLSFTIKLPNPSNTSVYKLLHGEGVFLRSAGDMMGFIVDGYYKAGTQAVTAIQFSFSAGNVESGEFTLYGMNNP